MKNNNVIGIVYYLSEQTFFVNIVKKERRLGRVILLHLMKSGICKKVVFYRF